MDQAGCWVVSYVNPDADGVITSLAYANLLGDLHSRPCLAGYFGILNAETRAILGFCDLEPPVPLDLVPGANEFVLVDTHHLSQLPNHFPAHKVTFVLDHHPAGDADLFTRAEIVNEAVGAAATLLYERMVLLERSIPAPIARALAGAVLSNTLEFMGPATTLRDRQAFEYLQRVGGWRDDFSHKMREARAELGVGSVHEVLRRDVKTFTLGGVQVSISQLELPSTGHLLAVDTLVEELLELQRDFHSAGVILNAVDLTSGSSTLVVPSRDLQDTLSRALDLNFKNSFATSQRILLRKTDLIPALASAAE